MAMVPASSAITTSRVEIVRLVVQRLDLLARVRAGRAKMVSALKLVRIEGVHRLGKLGHDVVRYVDDVVDRVQADRFEPVLQPNGDGCTVTFSNTSAL